MSYNIFDLLYRFLYISLFIGTKPLYEIELGQIAEYAIATGAGIVLISFAVLILVIEFKRNESKAEGNFNHNLLTFIMKFYNICILNNMYQKQSCNLRANRM